MQAGSELSAALDDAVERRKKARVREQMASADLDATLDEARVIYNQAYPRLQLTFPGDPALVESFFLDLRGAASPAGEQTPA